MKVTILWRYGNVHRLLLLLLLYYCHLLADRLESGISSGFLRSITSMGTFTCYYYYYYYYLLLLLFFFIPSASKISRDLETEKLAIENVRSDT